MELISDIVFPIVDFLFWDHPLIGFGSIVLILMLWAFRMTWNERRKNG